MSKATHKLVHVIAIAVAAFIVWRWWQHHSQRKGAQPDDPLLSRALDYVTGAPATVPMATTGASNPGFVPPALAPTTNADGRQPSDSAASGILGAPGDTPPIVVDHFPRSIDLLM